MSGKIKSNAYSPRLGQPNFMDIVSGSFVVRKNLVRNGWMIGTEAFDSRSDVLTVDWDLIGLGQHCGIEV